MTDPHTETLATPEEPVDPRADAIDAKNTLINVKLDLHAAARRAMKFDALPALQKAHAECLYALAGFHPANIVGELGPAEYRAIISDLEALGRIFAKMFTAYGREAGIDELDGCMDVALENAIAELEHLRSQKRMELAEHREHGSRMPMERV